jgi:hypothetical protein
MTKRTMLFVLAAICVAGMIYVAGALSMMRRAHAQGFQGWAPIASVPLSTGAFFEAPVSPTPVPQREVPRLMPTWKPLAWEYILPPPEPVRIPDLIYHGYTTGRIIPRDFLDSNGQSKW